MVEKLKNKSVVIPVIVILWIILVFFINNATFAFPGEKLLGGINTTVSLLSLLGIYFAYLQIIALKEQDRTTQNIRKQELNFSKAQKSVKLADEFRGILGDCSLLGAIFKKNEEFHNLMSAIEYTSFCTFKFTEYERLFENGQHKEIINSRYQYMYNNFNKTFDCFELYETIPAKYEEVIRIMQPYEFLEEKFFYALFNKDYSEDFFEEIKNKVKSKNCDDGLKQKYYYFVDSCTTARDFKFYVVNLLESKSHDVLNHLEVFSMAINLGLADDSPIYPSLHQSFLETIRFLYPQIAKSNDGEHVDHYYIHIRKLFGKWAIRYKDEITKHKQDVLEMERNDPKYEIIS